MKNLDNVIKIIGEEKQMIEKARGYQIELAELQAEFMKKKNNSEIEEIKKSINGKFEKLKSNTSRKFDNLMNLDYCDKLLKEKYTQKQYNSSTKGWITSILKKIKNLKKTC